MRFVSLHVAIKMTVMKNSMQNYQVGFADYQRRRAMDCILNTKILSVEMKQTQMVLIYPSLLDYLKMWKNNAAKNNYIFIFKGRINKQSKSINLS